MNPAIESGDQWWVRFSWDREGSRMSQMSVEATGLMFKLRGASWIKYGIPIEEESLARVLKYTCGMRLKRFYKLWDQISEFFEEKDGRLFFSDDEKERRKVVDISAKRKHASSLGNKVRWGRESQQASDPIPNGIPFGTTDNNNREPERQKEGIPQQPLQTVECCEAEVVEVEEVSQLNSTQTEPHGTPNGNPNGNSGGNGPESHLGEAIIESEGLTDQEYKEFCEYCSDPSSHPDHKPFTVPGRKLAERIKRKFKMPILLLPKFAGQQGAAMWDSPSVTIQQDDMEIARQKHLRAHPELAIKQTDKDLRKQQQREYVRAVAEQALIRKRGVA